MGVCLTNVEVARRWTSGEYTRSQSGGERRSRYRRRYGQEEASGARVNEILIRWCHCRLDVISADRIQRIEHVKVELGCRIGFPFQSSVFHRHQRRGQNAKISRIIGIRNSIKWNRNVKQMSKNRNIDVCYRSTDEGAMATPNCSSSSWRSPRRRRPEGQAAIAAVE